LGTNAAPPHGGPAVNLLLGTVHCFLFALAIEKAQVIRHAEPKKTYTADRILPELLLMAIDV
jgi:hypothetical protein